MNATSPHATPPLARHAPEASGEGQDTLPDPRLVVGPRACLHCRHWLSMNGRNGFCRQTTGKHAGHLRAATLTCEAWEPEAPAISLE